MSKYVTPEILPIFDDVFVRSVSGYSEEHLVRLLNKYSKDLMPQAL